MLICLTVGCVNQPRQLIKGTEKYAVNSRSELLKIEQGLYRIHSTYAKEQAPGVAVSVVYNGKIVYENGVGLANLEYRIPITKDTVFDIASVSKQFTAMAIAMLIDQGKLSLEDDVRTYLKDLPDYGVPIKLKQLLYHTSGLRDWLDLMLSAGWSFGDAITVEQIHKTIISQNNLNFVPGKEYSYSNTGYYLLSQIVSQVTGVPFSEWMNVNIFLPLGMTNTHVHDDLHRIVNNRANSYFKDNETFKVMNHGAEGIGGGSIFSTVSDMAKWALNFDNVTVGTANVMAMMSSAGYLDNGTQLTYGFGNVVGDDHNGLRFVHHAGRWPKFSSFLIRFPEVGLSICLLANSDDIDFWKFAFELVEVFGIPKEDNSIRVAAPSIFPEISEDHKLKIPGVYLRKETTEAITIELDKNQLVYKSGKDDGRKMMHLEGNHYRYFADYGATDLVFSADFSRFDFAEAGVESSFHRVKPIRYDSTDLQQYEGTYRSPELETEFTLTLEEGKLVAQHKRHEDAQMEHFFAPDLFTTEKTFLSRVQFSRDQNNRVNGFYVSYWQTRRVWFERL